MTMPPIYLNADFSFVVSFSDMFWLFAAFLLVVHVAADINGIFTNINSIVASSSAALTLYPASTYWTATVQWSINGANVNAGDTFALHMPHVFKFTSSSSSISLSAGGITYATCTFFSGEFMVNYSELQCKISPGLNFNDIAIGSVMFPITFDSGFSSSTNALEAANTWTTGTNTVTWTSGSYSISTTVDFEGGTLSSSPNLRVAAAKLAPSSSQVQFYSLGTSCPFETQSGTLGITFKNGGPPLQCSTLTASFSNQFNDWYFPQTASSLSYSVLCSLNLVMVTFAGVPAGSRPFFNIFASLLPVGRNSAVYTLKYRCGNGPSNDYSYDQGWSSYDNGNSGSLGGNFINTIVTKTYTDLTTRISTLPYSSTVTGATRTIEVGVPVPTITTTKTYTGSITTTTTISATPGQTGTVEIDWPVPRRAGTE